MPSGTYLEGQFDLSFELNNQVFSTSDAASLPGSFTFPADVPLTDANKVALGHPHLVTNAKNWQVYEGVWVECYGVPMFYGTLKITEATPKKCRVNIVANPISRLKDINLNQLDLGGDRTIGSGIFLIYMDLTARDPESYDFSFFPVYNNDRNGYLSDFGDPYNEQRPYFNYYDIPTSSYTEQSGAIVPFVKLRYLLGRIFAAENTGFSFANVWQQESDVELGRIFLFNNSDCRTLDGSGVPELPDIVNLCNHVPPIKAVELLKKVCALWGLGLFTNVFDRTIRLVPLQSILSRPPKHDWTGYVIGEPTNSGHDDAPGKYCYEQLDSLPFEVPPVETLEVFNTALDFVTALPTLADGYYYIESEVSIIKVVSNAEADGWLQLRGVTIGSGATYDPGVQHFSNIYHDDRYDSPVVASRYVESTDEFGDPVWEWVKTDPPVAFMMYRGFNDTGILAGEWPVSSNHVWDTELGGGERWKLKNFGTVVGTSQYSLNWHGEYGLFNSWHQTWAYMLNDGKHITHQFALPIADLVAFSMEDKIRVLNMDYFVKRLRIGKPLGAGKVLVEASMVSVI